ncbi:helix-turn-helix transcriptional regulator [Rhizorhabdus wittichii DC-6]|uniref:Regulatory protein, LuxR n=2 Tax=Rhizorhabdus wittichii TaxID=160791 RepID=A0A9J9H8A5_RHIWR|nr:regulatory protein, LuxR [Rhizorhabdus wittichii RW1]ARR56668.1 helix-turn-helix transcriptional regulator [Rhizorhabdus wittichii DC-6]
MRYFSPMSIEAISKLTARQRDCLRLVLHHKQSKEIGRELGISPMTVDNHFRSAIQTLGVSNRLEAALMLASHEGDEPSQRLTSQPHPVVSPAESSIMASSSDIGDGQREMTSALREDQVPYRTYREASFIDFPLPVPTRGKPRNDLSIAQRLFWIAILIFGMGLGAGALLSGFAALTNIALALKH